MPQRPTTFPSLPFLFFSFCHQVLDIQRAIAAKLRRFTFEGTEMNLKWSAWCSITMNPGYAGEP